MPAKMYEVPETVVNAAYKGYMLSQVHKRGGTDVGRRMAKKLFSNKYVTLRTVKKISQYFPRHQYDRLNEDGKAGRQLSNGYIAWLLWGGDAGWRWSKRIVEREEEK